MRNQVLTVLIAIAAIGPALAESPTSMKDLIQQDYTRLSGTFRMTSGMIDGKEVPDDVRRQTVLVTNRNKFTVSDRGTAGTSAEGIFTIDPTKSPKTADSVQGTGPDKGKTMLGIYEIIDDNHKRACWAPVGMPRPTSFTSEPGSGHILQVWERIEG